MFDPINCVFILDICSLISNMHHNQGTYNRLQKYYDLRINPMIDREI